MPDIQIAVTPRSAANRVGPYRDGVLRVRVTRPPSEGEANRAVLSLVARALRLPPSRLILVSGERSRRKRLRVEGLDAVELARRLSAIDAN